MKKEQMTNEEQAILLGYLTLLKNDGFTPKTAKQLSDVTVEKMMFVFENEKKG